MLYVLTDGEYSHYHVVAVLEGPDNADLGALTGEYNAFFAETKYDSSPLPDDIAALPHGHERRRQYDDQKRDDYWRRCTERWAAMAKVGITPLDGKATFEEVDGDGREGHAFAAFLVCLHGWKVVKARTFDICCPVDDDGSPWPNKLLGAMS